MMMQVIKRALSSKDDKVIAILYKNENGSYGVGCGFLGYKCENVSYGVACDEFENGLIQADCYLHLNGKYYIIDYTKEDKQ